MTFRILRPFLFFAVVTFLLSSCSNSKKEYEPVQRLQIATEQTIASTSDDDAKLKSCDSVITALQKFMRKHAEGEWNLTAKAALENWQAKRDSISKSWQATKDSLQEVVSRRTDFEEIQKLQDAAEDVMQHSFDYAVRMKSCADMINALQEYLLKHPTSEWSTSAETALMSWKSRRAALVQELGSAFNKLSLLMKQRAIQEAQKVHNWSYVKRCRWRNPTRLPSVLPSMLRPHMPCVWLQSLHAQAYLSWRSRFLAALTQRPDDHLLMRMFELWNELQPCA